MISIRRIDDGRPVGTFLFARRGAQPDARDLQIVGSAPEACRGWVDDMWLMTSTGQLWHILRNVRDHQDSRHWILLLTHQLSSAPSADHGRGRMPTIRRLHGHIDKHWHRRWNWRQEVRTHTWAIPRGWELLRVT